ncbi:MAG: alpha-D-ribose 1-methylphosphonate 5-phosphate C-P-lyase PhnJ [Proteobacteria bacterium]|nr:alpha-D-ribose 1-methylphosphonate 5-phosphate C-P-lyase PhnJ [Pseudomonadota bacterium]MBU1138895.1 alpha-D-ribose 1-methylphosphonate 5-phosphate C-P-lyase PhnJ [Pseudomonadota bacterium]MBU1234022.1 alpha-D-ribose 1-methylphosphonate 5-phosphate C-P-lyase PhnJ [Pseudomonadota bacterium]MBU1418749.1 alpha-D-ribose 1-methylphosphonate 5-phosphate C-P-lyase PhnJ [Pseudomonadota bacterium]MBU1455487.1 alpha-D-ribose 1-methylphosphonate 5-phosphate C-P-lyase PhnJ [Pseudomonadota bacterium]
MNESVFAFMDEDAKKEIRRTLLKAVAIPGYTVPFASREMPVARGWGTGGLQITLSLLLKRDCIKVIDQGCDGSVNAVNIRDFIASVSGVKQTFSTREATIIQTRHRIPEHKLAEGQILVFQVPYPEVLTTVEPDTEKQKQMHADSDYSKLWVLLYEDTSQFGDSRISNRYPVEVEDHYVMDPSPIPKYDIPRLNNSPALLLFGAGREKRIYAIPPYTKVEPLKFSDRPFKVETFAGKRCGRCGADNVFLDEVRQGTTSLYFCSDTEYCDSILTEQGDVTGNTESE